MVCFSSNGSRLRNTVRDGDDRSADSMWQMEQIMELIENTHSRRNFGPEMPSLPITSWSILSYKNEILYFQI